MFLDRLDLGKRLEALHKPLKDICPAAVIEAGQFGADAFAIAGLGQRNNPFGIRIEGHKAHLIERIEQGDRQQSHLRQFKLGGTLGRTPATARIADVPAHAVRFIDDQHERQAWDGHFGGHIHIHG